MRRKERENEREEVGYYMIMNVHCASAYLF